MKCEGRMNNNKECVIHFLQHTHASDYRARLKLKLLTSSTKEIIAFKVLP